MKHIVLGVTLVLSGIAIAGQPAFVDEFDQVDFDARWEFYTPAAGPNFELDGANFIIDMPSGDYDSWVNFDRCPRLRTSDFDTTGDFAVETHVIVEHPTTATYFQTGIWVGFQDLQGGPIDGWFWGFYSSPGWVGPHTLRVERVGNRSTGYGSNTTPAHWGVAETHLKVERIGDRYTFYYKEQVFDAWILFHSTTSPGQTVIDTGVFAKNWGGLAEDVRASFDYFRLCDPTTIAPNLADVGDVIAFSDIPFSLQITLAEGFPLPTWSLTSAPTPTNAPAINSTGRIDWLPAATDVGKTFTFRVKATNLVGNDTTDVKVSVLMIRFLRGDSNADGTIDISDGVAILNYLFLGGTAVSCEQAGDANDDGLLDISDGIFVLNFLFLGGKAIEPPVGICGVDPTGHALPCSSFDSCGESGIEGFTQLGSNAQGYPEYRHDQTGIIFVRLSGGTFYMGAQSTDSAGQNYDPSTDLYESPVHMVTLSPFLIAKYEVTQAQWTAVMGSNPSWFTGDDDRPVEQVSWDDIKGVNGFCFKTGLILPTEAQWEYACRAGTTGPYTGTGNLGDMGWYWDNSESTTHPVGQKNPNQFGLFDMHGNVCEWCEDVLDPTFYSKPEAGGPDPVSTTGSVWKVIRGGCWGNSAPFCRSAFRGSTEGPSSITGFRPAAPLP